MALHASGLATDNPSMNRRILGLALPVMAEMALQTFTQIVSMALVGHLGPNAVTSIGLSVQPLNMIYTAFMGLSIGTTAVVSRAVGAQDRETAGHSSAQALSLAAMLALIVGPLVLALSKPIVLWMGADPSIAPDSARYLAVMVPGLMAMWTVTVLSGALRGAGDTRTPMRVNIAVNVISFLGHLLLVRGLFGFPQLGILGAGLAASFARVIGLPLLLFPYLRNKTCLFVRSPRAFLPDRSVLARIWKISFPAACERIFMNGGQLPYARMVSGLGTQAYAAHLIGINTETISSIPGIGFSTAATTLSGQSLGAKRADLAEHGAYQTLKLAAVFMGTMALIMLFFPRPLTAIYTDDPEVLRLGATNLRFMAATQLLVAVGASFTGTIRGAGDTRFVVYMIAFTVWVVRLGVSYLLVHHFKIGVTGAWWGMTVDWCFRATLTYLWFRKGGWKHIDI